MTATRLCVEVSCDGPDECTDCPDSAAVRRSFDSVTAPQVRADGRTQGWTTRRRNGRLRDLCPTCRAGQPAPQRCEQCGRTGTRGFTTHTSDEHHIRITVCTAKTACRKRRPKPARDAA